MTAQTQHGYLILADISGYTSYVAKTELEHSQEIVGELLDELQVGASVPTSAPFRDVEATVRELIDCLDRT